jgi:hypothetical protein
MAVQHAELPATPTAAPRNELKGMWHRCMALSYNSSKSSTKLESVEFCCLFYMRQPEAQASPHWQQAYDTQYKAITIIQVVNTSKMHLSTAS